MGTRQQYVKKKIEHNIKEFLLSYIFFCGRETVNALPTTRTLEQPKHSHLDNGIANKLWRLHFAADKNGLSDIEFVGVAQHALFVSQSKRSGIVSAQHTQKMCTRVHKSADLSRD